MNSKNKVKDPKDKIIQEITAEGIDFFVRFMQMMGMPRSIGEIYGLLYFSEEPLSMENVTQSLGMSVGSASQGLKSLRNMKAIRTSYKIGERKDYFIAESEFRHLFSTFIRDEIVPHLESAKDRTEKMSELSDKLPSENKEFLKQRIGKLNRLQKAATKVLPTLSTLLRF
jgi:DNA-binding transcriptional regulator GbsR (MarR family)